MEWQRYQVHWVNKSKGVVINRREKKKKKITHVIATRLKKKKVVFKNVYKKPRGDKTNVSFQIKKIYL